MNGLLAALPEQYLTIAFVLQLLSANKFLDMSTITEWLFVVPEYQLQRLVSFLEVQVTFQPTRRSLLPLESVP